MIRTDDKMVKPGDKMTRLNCKMTGMTQVAKTTAWTDGNIATKLDDIMASRLHMVTFPPVAMSVGQVNCPLLIWATNDLTTKERQRTTTKSSDKGGAGEKTTNREREQATKKVEMDLETAGKCRQAATNSSRCRHQHHHYQRAIAMQPGRADGEEGSAFPPGRRAKCKLSWRWGFSLLPPVCLVWRPHAKCKPRGQIYS